MGTEWNDGLAGQIIALQKVAKDPWHIAPPDGIADKDRVIGIHIVHRVGNFRAGIVVHFLPGHIQKPLIGSRIGCFRFDLKKIGSGLFCDYVGDNAGISFLYNAYVVLFSRKRKISHQHTTACCCLLGLCRIICL